MNQKEVSELRRRWRLEKNAVSHIYGCFVNANKEIIADLDESLGMMTQEEGEQYMSLLKKTLSGGLGKNLIDIVFSTQQVMDSPEHRQLMELRSSRLKDGQLRRQFYQTVTDSLDMGGSGYLLLLACDSYDVPRRGRDGEEQQDASEEVFTYLLCGICPLKLGKPELNYYPGDNEFHCAVSQTVAPPELGFLFPAFDDRTANIYNALFYARKADELHQEFIDAVFRTEPPMSAGEQRETFQSALAESLEDGFNVEIVQAVHEQLTDRILRHKESKDPEPLALTARDVGSILQDCGVTQERVEDFRKRCDEQFGADAALSPANLIDAGRFQLKTAQAVVSVAPENCYLVETRIINGRKYILVPAEEDVEVNGLAVRFTADQEPQ
ncbi:MAG: DUF4317 domain-containing protein [Lawsonibacter sp.]|jgi:hypothetical protein|uniref:DUF4317 domain-containing protein n=1 Tax=Lawsonibacter sp. JLR.KK007 TaxID=3114293 RepID=UPI00216F768C|nr:DUF4317 domain-containing protein [Lawsonibacter sp.]MCI8989606.1 DUF4317 domain-containing protein [Lawsonibacter sp.]